MLLVKILGSESCLWRWRGLLELCKRLLKFSEPRVGGASIPLKRHCSSTTCLLLGSFCPAHASPSVSADCSGPTQKGCSPACRVAPRRGCPGDLCMTSRTCCLSVLARRTTAGICSVLLTFCALYLADPQEDSLRDSWRWFSRLLSRHRFGATKSRRRAGALREEVQRLLRQLLSLHEAFSKALYNWSKQAA